jgi:hypothetical protein
MSIRTEEADVSWVRRFILFHGKRHPTDMGAEEIRAFLTHLAVHGKVAAAHCRATPCYAPLRWSAAGRWGRRQRREREAAAGG